MYGLFASERLGRLGVSHELSCVFVLTEKTHDDSQKMHARLMAKTVDD